MEHIHENISERQGQERSQYRDRIEVLRSRVSLLASEDRLLMTMYLENGNSFRQIARLSGVNETTISRRIRRITRKLIDNEYLWCLRHRNKFTRAELTVAKEYFMAGLAMKSIVKQQKLSYYHVRQIIEKIQQLIKFCEQQ